MGPPQGCPLLTMDSAHGVHTPAEPAVVGASTMDSARGCHATLSTVHSAEHSERC
jgi:hypothetical protein